MLSKEEALKGVKQRKSLKEKQRKFLKESLQGSL